MSDLESRQAAFLAGEAPDDVAIYLADSFVDDLGRLEQYGVHTDDGIRIVVDGDSGRDAFQAATGMDAMTFAQGAMGTDGDVAADLTSGTCPDGDDDLDDDSDVDRDADHSVEFVFAFAEAQKDPDEFDGIYTEGDVLHAYAHCTCGTAYADKWLAADADAE